MPGALASRRRPGSSSTSGAGQRSRKCMSAGVRGQHGELAHQSGAIVNGTESPHSDHSSRTSPILGGCLCPAEPAEEAHRPSRDEHIVLKSEAEDERKLSEVAPTGLQPGPSGGEETTVEAEVSRDWLEEEARLQAENEAESERLQREIELHSEHELREERYKRLLRLLNTSQFYVNYLVDKIEDQHEKRRTALAERAKRDAKKRTAGEAVAPRRSARAANKENVAAPSKRKRAATACRGRKAARVEDDSAVSSQTSCPQDSGSQTGASDADSQPEAHVATPAAEDGAQPRLLSGGVLRDYQLEGYNWLRVMFENGVNCILGDEMGLGKTIQTVALLAYLMEQGVVGPFLVVAPLSTLPNWLLELQRFAPDIPTVVYHGSDRHTMLSRIDKFYRLPGCRVPMHPVVVTSYDVVIRDATLLSKYQWRYLVVDEAHRLKNHQCRLVRELRRFTSVNRLLLTGTPLQNSLAELWSLLNFIMPEIFDDLAVFESWFDATGMTTAGDDDKIVEQEREMQVVSTLHGILTPFFLRRIKCDVDLDIPPKREVLVYCPLTEDQHRLYRATVDKTIATLMGKRHGDDPEAPPELDRNGRPRRSCKEGVSFEFLFSDGADVMEDEARWEDGVRKLDEARGLPAKSSKPKDVRIHLRMQNKMMILRHVVNHPFLVEHPIDPETREFLLVPELVEKSGKLMVLDAMLARLRASGHKILIFSQFTMMLDILADFLTLRGHAFVRLDGTCSIEDRQQCIGQFTSDPDLGVFLISTRAGGLGINLCAADTVIIYDSDWNPQCDLQAQDRAHRIGQTRPVVVYRLVAAGTIDQRIVERAAAKRKLEKMVMHAGKFKSGRRDHVSTSLAPISPDELLALLRDQQHQRMVDAGGAALTDAQLDALLDHTDLVQAWQQKRNVASRRADNGVFEVLEDEETAH